MPSKKKQKRSKSSLPNEKPPQADILLSKKTHKKSSSKKPDEKSPKKPETVYLIPQRGEQIQRSGRVVRRLTVTVPVELGKAIAVYCAETGRSMSEVVTEQFNKLLQVS